MKRLLILLLAGMSCMAMSATRTHLIQTAWDQDNYNSMLPKFSSDSTPVKSGCTTIAAAQVINYYGWLPEFDVDFHIDVTDSIFGWAPGTTEVHSDESTWYWNGTYHVDSMPCSTDSLITSLFYSEASLIDREIGTSTSVFSLFGCFNNRYKYDIEAYVDEEDYNADQFAFAQKVSAAQQEEIVKTAIAEGKPVIVNGTDHTFIIDGYDEETNEFHFNYGWGPTMNRWAAYNSWDDGVYSTYIVTPNREKVWLPEIRVSDSIPLHFKNTATQEDHIGYMTVNGYFRFEEDWENNITPGEYEVWLEWPDGTIFAPQLPEEAKTFGDSKVAIVTYNFSHDKGIFRVTDPSNYGFVLSATIYYDTHASYFDIQCMDKVTQEGLDNNAITAVVDGVSYRLTKHQKDYYTVPIRKKRGEKVEWMAYYRDLSYGLVSYSNYPDVEFDKEGQTLIVYPQSADEEHYYDARYVNDYGLLSGSGLGGFATYNATRPFRFVMPTALYRLKEEYDYYEGPLSTLDSVASDYVYVGVSFDAQGARMFVYNQLPTEYEMETGVAFISEKDTTTYSLAPGSPVPAAPEASAKPGYTFLGWDPAPAAGDTVANDIKEYYAVYERGDYHTYQNMYELVDDGEPTGQGVFVTFSYIRIDSITANAEGVGQSIRVTVGEHAIRLRCEEMTAVPADWAPLGIIEGTVFGWWQVVDDVWTLTLSTWDGITYTPGPPFADGRYYIYNQGAQAYMSHGAAEGMPVTVDGAGAAISLSMTLENSYLFYLEGDDRFYMTGEGWKLYDTDYLRFEEAGDGVYYLTNGEGSYLHWAGGAGLQGDNVVVGEKAATDDYLWRVVDAESREALTANADVTYLIANPDFSAGSDNWTGNMSISGSTAAQQDYSGAYAVAQATSGSLDTVVLRQCITLPRGQYRLTANANAEQDGSAATNTWLYAGSEQTAIGLTGQYSVEFIASGRPMEIGIKAESTSAKLISLDELRLTYLGEPVVNFPTMTITYDTMRMTLTFSPSDKEAHYLLYNNRTEYITYINPDTYFDQVVANYTWEEIEEYNHPISGDTTIAMSQYINWGWTGDWTAFANFIDPTTMIVSQTARCDYDLRLPVIEFPTITISYDSTTHQLTFTPSDKNVYYLADANMTSDLESMGLDLDTYFRDIAAGYSWEDLLTYFGNKLHKGDFTMDLSNEYIMQRYGDRTAYVNFVDSISMTTSATTRYEFVMKQPEIAFPSIVISYNAQTMELTFTPSDKEAYYLVAANLTEDLQSWEIDPDTYFSETLNGYTWADVQTYFSSGLHQGDLTMSMSQNLDWGWTGDWTAFCNFIDPASMTVSATTKLEFVLEQQATDGRLQSAECREQADGAQKVVRDGQVIIIRDGVEYLPTGQER